ncbi:MAG: hypothetical protein Ta2E_08340 [Mycoplasmoidaceae bacterium]|nr:MAG: hypothetical protein Ta2E_08340 [Mycoplasmoidaceae bacterium]
MDRALMIKVDVALKSIKDILTSNTVLPTNIVGKVKESLRDLEDAKRLMMNLNTQY